MIEAAGVVIPARDEEHLLPSCLAAVNLAVRTVPRVAVRVIVVADTCGDRTASLAAQAGATVVQGTMSNVGKARLAGVEELLRQTRALDPASVWIATTDADSLVPPCWLSRQLRHASHGWEAVVGTVTVTDWAGYPPRNQAVYAERYAGGLRVTGTDRWHPHVHGANLGVTAAAYRAAGGFRPLPTGEDHALVRALESAGRRILRTTDVTVVTSARRDARAPGGFGHFLTRLEQDTMPNTG